MMGLTRSGIILCTERYEACVDFYRRILELPELFSLDNEHSKLTCLDMAGSYLTFAASDLSALLHTRLTPRHGPTGRRRGHGPGPAQASTAPRCRSTASPP